MNMAHGPYRALMQPLVKCPVSSGIPIAESRYKTLPFALRRPHRVQSRAIAHNVGPQRLFCEYMLVGCDRGFYVERAEAGRRCQEHHVNSAVEHLEIGVEPNEHVV